MDITLRTETNFSILNKKITRLAAIVFIWSSFSLNGQKELNLFFEGQLHSRGIEVNKAKLLVIDQSGFHSFMDINNKFKFAITPNRTFVLTILKKGFVPEIMILNTNTKQIPFGDKTISKSFALAQYDPTSDKWKAMTKLSKMEYISGQENFVSKNLEINDTIKTHFMDLLFAKKFKNLLKAVLEQDPGSTDEKFTSIFSKETKALQNELGKLYTQEMIAKERVAMSKKGIIYAAQIGAFSKEIPKNHFFHKNVNDLNYLLAEDNIYRYYSGDFNNLDDALDHINTLSSKGITQAFAIAIYAGRRILIPQKSDSTRNPDIDKWNAKLKILETELEFLTINQSRLITQENTIRSELAEIEGQKSIAIEKEDTLSKRRSLTKIKLNLQKNTARTKIKSEKLEVAKQNLRSALKGEIFAEDGRTRLIRDTVYVETPVIAEIPDYGWELGIARGIQQRSHDQNSNELPLKNRGGYNTQIALTKSFSKIFHLGFAFNLGSFEENGSTISNNSVVLQPSISLSSLIKNPDSSTRIRNWDFRLNGGIGQYRSTGTLPSENIWTTGIQFSSKITSRLDFTTDISAYFFPSDLLEGQVRGSGLGTGTDYTLFSQLKLSYNFDIIIQRKTSIAQPGVGQRKL